MPETVPTADDRLSNPPAIGERETNVGTERPVKDPNFQMASESSIIGRLAGHDIDGVGCYLHYFAADPGTRRGTVILE